MARTINRILLLILKLSISSALLYFVLSKAGVDNVLSLIRAINPVAFIGAIVIYVFSIYVSTIRWGLFLPEEFKSKRLFSFYMIGSFFNTFLPGIIGGDAVKSYYLYKEINKGSLSLASVFMDRYIGFISLMSIGLVAFIFGFKYLKGSVIEWLLPAIILIFLVGSIIVFGLRFGKKIRVLSEFYKFFDEYRNQKILIAKALLLSVIIQVMCIMSVYIITLGLGEQIALIYFYIFFPIITAISTLPVSISGIGVREWSFVLLFGVVGVKPEIATAMSFAWFLSIAFGGLVGFFEYLRLRK